MLYQVENSKLRCLACYHKCLIAEGKRGICGVRENQGGKLVLLVHSKVSAKHVDPIEKKPLYHFLPGTQVYSIGTVGCNLHCGFCQNWQMSQERKILGEELTPEQVKKEAAPYMSIAYTYNEPTIFIEYAKDIAEITVDKRHIFITNGYFSEEALLEMNFVDALNIDLKSFSDEFYQKTCGAKLIPILESIKRCVDQGKWVEITTLLIPGENDSEEELKRIARFIALVDKEIPWHISAFHPDYKMTNKPDTSFISLLKAHEIGREAGLAYIYLGNISDENYSSTFCPKCQKMLIRRNGYNVKIEGLKNGKCMYCHYPIKGVWS
ncbi:MAG: AmmeMemoRadiSam system radical SAM enzyme [Candidatus Woesearchaeota archaeon]